MNETRKALKRRRAEQDRGEFPWSGVFRGIGLDVGAEDDPLPNAIPFTLDDGAGDDLRKFFKGAQLDYIHASNVAEHLIDPVLGVASWISLLRPGGFLCMTVPDFLLYEGGVYPSRFNKGHRSTWSMTETSSPAPIHCKLPEWFALHHPGLFIMRCKLITTNYDFSKKGEHFVDQTFDAEDGVECFIEVLGRKL